MLTWGFGGFQRAAVDPVLSRINGMGCPAFVMSGTEEEGPIWGNFRARTLPPGRGVLVSRRRGSETLVQTVHRGA